MHQSSQALRIKALMGLAATIGLAALVSAAAPRAVEARCGGPGNLGCPRRGDTGKVPTKTPLPSETAIAIQPILSLPSGTPPAPSPTLTLGQQLQAYGAQTETAQNPSPTITLIATATQFTATPDEPVKRPSTDEHPGLPWTVAGIVLAALVGIILGALRFWRRLSRKTS